MKIFPYNLIVFLLLLNTLSYAQIDNTSGWIKNNIPSSPTAHALSKFGEISPNAHTGVPSVGLNLFNISSNQTSISASLNHHGSAIKVEDLSGNVGMKWALNLGGVISREIRDEPDDAYSIKKRLACFRCHECKNCMDCPAPNNTSLECTSCSDQDKACYRQVPTLNRSPIGYLYNGTQVETLYDKTLENYTPEDIEFVFGDELYYESGLMIDDIQPNDIVIDMDIFTLDPDCEDEVEAYLETISNQDAQTALDVIAFIDAVNNGHIVSFFFTELMSNLIDQHGVDPEILPYFDFETLQTFPQAIKDCLTFTVLRPQYELKDTEADIFSFNFPGGAGRFAFSPTGEVQLFSDQDLKIEYTLSADENLPSSDYADIGLESLYGGAITDFTITTPDGTQYVFAETEISVANATGQGLTGDIYRNYPECAPPFFNPYFYNVTDVKATYTSWHLTQILNSFGQVEFQFTYDEDITMNHNDINQQMTITKNEELDEYVANVSVSSNVSLILGKRLREVKWANGETFGTEGRLFLTYNTVRPDLYFPDDLPFHLTKRSKALDKIEWLDGQNNLLKEFVFGYGEFAMTPLNCSNPPEWLDAHRQRLRLESVTERGRDENGNIVEKPPWQFFYNETPLPPRHSPKQDFWGFYNGTAQSLLPHIYAYPDDTDNNADLNSIYSIYERQLYSGNEFLPNNFLGSNRRFNAQFAKAGTLEKVVYPVGGSLHLEYEGHDFLNNNHINPDGGGGIRIKRIYALPPVGNTPLLEKTYNYNYPTAIPFTSGKLTNMPNFVRANGNMDPNLCTIFSRSQTALSNGQGSVVVYERVEEIYTGRGKIVSVFDVATDFLTENDACTMDDCVYERAEGQSTTSSVGFPDNYPFPPNPNYDWNQGRLLEQHYVDEAGNTVRSMINEYELIGYTKIPSIKVVTTVEDVFAGAIQQTSFGKYYMLSGDKRLQKQTTTDYFPDGNVVRELTYEYGTNHHQPTAFVTNNSDGKVHRTEVDYAQEAGITCLEDRFMVAVPVEVRKFVDGVFQGGDRTVFQVFNGIQCLPKKNTAILNDNTLLDQMTVSDYDISGFETGMTQRGYPERTFTWDKGLLMSTSYGSTAGNTQTQNFDYTDGSRLLQYLQDIDGQEVFYTYDGLLRSQSISERGGAVVTDFQYEYGTINKVTTTTTFADDTPTQTTEQTIDFFGRPSETRINGVFKNGVYYDQSGRVRQQTYLPGNLTTFEYDNSPLDRLTKETYPVLSEGNVNSKTTTYGAENGYYKTTVIDENQNATSNIVDLLGRLYITRNALGDETIRYYDDRNNPTLIVSPEAQGDINHPNLNYIFTYDNRNRRTSEYIPGMEVGSSRTFTYYESHDLPHIVTDPNGNRLMYAYDDLGRNTETWLQEAGQPLNKVINQTRYDNDGLTTSDPINIGRVNQSKTLILDQPNTNTLLTTDFTYDSYGREQQVQSDNHIGLGDIVINTYNDADWISNITHSHNGFQNLDIIQDFTYDNFGRNTSLDYRINGQSMMLREQVWNDRDQLVQKMLGGGLQSIDYLYNSRGWLTNINQPLDIYDQNPGNLPPCTVTEFNDNTDEPSLPDYEFCTDENIDLVWMMQIRFQTDITLDCYEACPMTGGTEMPTCSDEAIAEAAMDDALADMQQLYGMESSVLCADGSTQITYIPQPSNLIFPTTLYRIRICTGREMYVLEEALDNLQHIPYAIVQTIEVVDERQLFRILDENGMLRYVNLTELLLLVLEGNETTGINDYIISTEPCNPAPPDCTFEEIEEQRMALEAIRAANLQVENLTFPTCLYRVKLCDGTEVYLFEQELPEMPGNYTILQTLCMNDAERTFQVGNTFSNIDISDLFHLHLRYDEDAPDTELLEGAAQKNGNISWMTWQVKGRQAQFYGFQYDALDRLKKANYAEVRDNNSLVASNFYSMEVSEYDRNGNIKSLNRNGFIEGLTFCVQPIDELLMTHDGNRLSTVTDGSTASHLAYGFKPGAGGLYQHDLNENMIYDPHKNMTVVYNFLNLADSYAFSGSDKVEVLCDGAGRRLRKTVSGTENYVVDYVGQIEYKNGVLEAVYNDEGRAVPNNSGGFDFEWTLRDHLGNTRVLFKAEPTTGQLSILQENHFYPFGGEFNLLSNQPSETNPEHNYLYNNKLLDKDYGVDLYNYGFRGYDKWLSRFTGADPISEDFAWVSTFNYAENSPIAHIDLWGLQKRLGLRPGETLETVQARNAFDYAAKEILLRDLVDNNKIGIKVTLGNDPAVMQNENVPGGIVDFNLHGSKDGKMYKIEDGVQTDVSDNEIEEYIDENPEANGFVFGLCYGEKCNLERFADYSNRPVITTGKNIIGTDKDGQDVGSDSYIRYDPIDENGVRRVIQLKREDFLSEIWTDILKSLGLDMKNN